jgi:phage regulator Rha-like protein
MNALDLVTVTTNTMSSKEVAELVESRHDSVKRAIERLSTPQLNEDGSVKRKAVIVRPPMVDEQFADTMGRIRTESVYQLKERDSYIVVAQLCPEFTAKLVDYWQATKNAFEGLPTIQKQEQALRLTPYAVAAAKSYGFEGNQATISADRAVKTMTGVSPLALMGAELKKEVQALNLTPTEIGKQLSPPISAIKVNKRLEALGYQEKLGDSWVPTQKGKPYAVFIDTGKKHSDGTPITQLKWFDTILENL